MMMSEIEEPRLPAKKPLVVRMQNPAAYRLPEVRGLILKANSRTQDAEFRSARLAASCQDPRVGIFIGIENGLPRCIVAIELPFGDIRLCVGMLAIATNEGSREVGDATFDTAMSWALNQGCKRIYTVNTSGHSEAVYQRRLRIAGVRARPLYMTYELVLAPEESLDVPYQTMPPVDQIFDFSAPPFQPSVPPSSTVMQQPEPSELRPICKSSWRSGTGFPANSPHPSALASRTPSDPIMWRP
jgi:hypothetical protein